MFGTDDSEGKPQPFHLYSMRQAIEEGFILDVLQNYNDLTRRSTNSPRPSKMILSWIERRQHRRLPGMFSLHPPQSGSKDRGDGRALSQLHLQTDRRQSKGNGRHPISACTPFEYKREFDRYLKEKGYTTIRALVAFSGTVKDGGLDFTEAGMNGFGEKELPRRFDTDEYQLLIVAEKYQTGFDQPLLHTMYVDRKLEGLQAVQTLSRLNRTCSGKEDTFVLDFVNEAAEIKESFKPYYEKTEVEERVDPNLLYTLKHKLDAFQIYWAQEIEDFAKVFFKPLEKQRETDKGLLHKCIDPAVARFQGETEERQTDFRHQLGTYLRLYSFMSQLVDFKDPIWRSSMPTGDCSSPSSRSTMVVGRSSLMMT